MTANQSTPQTCATCGSTLSGPHGYCGNCDAHYCIPCSRTHFCTPTCQANGCFAGLCVRLIRDGKLSKEWGVPAQERLQDTSQFTVPELRGIVPAIPGRTTQDLDQEISEAMEEVIERILDEDAGGAFG